MSPIVQKITGADPGTFVLFYVPECPYCQRALSTLRERNLPFKGYNINNISGNMPRLLQVLTTYSNLTGFNPYHTTKPIIFINGKFVGGMDDLAKYLDVQFTQ